MTVKAILLSILFVVGGSADLHQNLHYFETLNTEDLNMVTRGKRSADGRVLHSRHIKFRTLGRNFNMVLYPDTSVLSPSFRAKTIDAHGNMESFSVNPKNFFSGYLEDDKSVRVDAHFEDGILSSTIQFPNDTYVIEPSWRHRQPWENYSMISYRGSDVNWDQILPIDPKTGKRTEMKDGIRLHSKSFQNNRRVQNTNTTISVGNSRHKRSVSKNTCPLLLVADYTFYRDMGNRKRSITASFLISSIQNVNILFKRTVWDSQNGYLNMGFQIDEMLIHTSFSDVPGHYNSDKDWHYNAKLYAFSRNRRLLGFCLAHLYTSYAFPDEVLGLAFIAPEHVSEAGGICSKDTRKDGMMLFPRTGWSSAKNSRSILLLSLQFQLVTTHEFGHNWGSEHDTDSSECAPSSHDGGKYVMWGYAVQGYYENNKYFSPCSKRLIAPVLRSKSFLCFREFVEEKNLENQTESDQFVETITFSRKVVSDQETDVRSMCGNGIIEEGEKCDVGFLEDDEEDLCCDKKCQLKNGANCSSFNHPCCRNCLMAPKGVLCEERNNLTCKDQSFCNGSSLECPAPPNLPDNTKCIDLGVCRRGECLNFCEVLGFDENKILNPCICAQNVTAMCLRCCMEMAGNKIIGECLPTDVRLPPGRTCNLGVCDENGRCAKVEQQLALRIFSFIKDLTVDNLVALMRTNIVGSVLVLSLIIWIPASWIISCIDKRNAEERNLLLPLSFRENAILGKSREDLADFRIKNSRFTRIPQASPPYGNVDSLSQRSGAVQPAGFKNDIESAV